MAGINARTDLLLRGFLWSDRAAEASNVLGLRGGSSLSNRDMTGV